MKSIRSALMLISLLCFSSLSMATETGTNAWYAVIFGIVVDQNNLLNSFRIAKVINPFAENPTAAIDLKIPDTYIAEARKHIIDKKQAPEIKNGKPQEFFTYFFYDPKRPNRADLDPKNPE